MSETGGRGGRGRIELLDSRLVLLIYLRITGSIWFNLQLYKFEPCNRFSSQEAGDDAK